MPPALSRVLTSPKYVGLFANCSKLKGRCIQHRSRQESNPWLDCRFLSVCDVLVAVPVQESSMNAVVRFATGVESKASLTEREFLVVMHLIYVAHREAGGSDASPSMGSENHSRRFTCAIPTALASLSGYMQQTLATEARSMPFHVMHAMYNKSSRVFRCVDDICIALLVLHVPVVFFITN